MLALINPTAGASRSCKYLPAVRFIYLVNQVIPKCMNNHLYTIIHPKLIKDIANMNLYGVLTEV